MFKYVSDTVLFGKKKEATRIGYNGFYFSACILGKVTTKVRGNKAFT
jgi:hypothetical protein